MQLSKDFHKYGKRFYGQNANYLERCQQYAWDYVKYDINAKNSSCMISLFELYGKTAFYFETDKFPFGIYISKSVDDYDIFYENKVCSFSRHNSKEVKHFFENIIKISYNSIYNISDIVKNIISNNNFKEITRDRFIELNGSSFVNKYEYRDFLEDRFRLLFEFNESCKYNHCYKFFESQEPKRIQRNYWEILDLRWCKEYDYLNLVKSIDYFLKNITKKQLIGCKIIFLQISSYEIKNDN